MDYLQYALSMNNGGVVRLLNDDRRGAFDLFKASFACMTEGHAYCTSALPSPMRPQHFPKMVSDSTLPFLPMPIPFNDDDRAASRSASPESPDCEPEGTHAFTFTKAFVFNPNIQVNEDGIEAYKAVVLFNLALLYHQRDLHYSDRYDSTALDLYSTCLALIKSPSPLNCSNVVIACLNNKAQLFYEQHDLDATARMLRELGQFLGKAIDEGAEALDERDINGLLLNVHCQRALVCAPSA